MQDALAHDAHLAGVVQRFGAALNARGFHALASFYSPSAVASWGLFGSHEGNPWDCYNNREQALKAVRME